MKCANFTFYILICIGLFFYKSSHAQVADDYRTRATGNWSATTTWQRFDGVAWQNVTGVIPNTVPTSGDGNITILNGHTVTVASAATFDQIAVNSGGKLTINSSTPLDQVTVN